MANLKTKNGELKLAIKQALQELLIEDREFLRDVLLEAIEDVALGELILEARKSRKKVSREVVFKILEERA